MPAPLPTQLTGALFLAERSAALLADEQRVGKTGAAVIACDYVFARKILVVTKSSARANWGRDVRVWQAFPRSIQVIFQGHEKVRDDADVVVVGWGMVFDKRIIKQLMARDWCVLILDECDEARNPDAKRTIAVYGAPEAERWANIGLCVRADYVWPMSGTPIPNAPNDLFPMLRALAPERLADNDNKGWGDVLTYERFMKRYCVVRPSSINGRRIDVVVAGKNEDELAARLEGFWLRRTQADIGITQPIFELFAVTPGNFGSATLKRALDAIGSDAEMILEAAAAGETKTLELHLAELRHITGQMKAHAVVEAVKDELDGGLDKIVLMAWHTNVIDILREGLSAYGVVGIDGRTSAVRRQVQEEFFRDDKSKRVFVGQIQAAGAAIDLSSSSELMFVEPSFVPRDMAQAAMRITNINQQRQPRVRVCALDGSIDEALMMILTRKVESIVKVQA